MDASLYIRMADCMKRAERESQQLAKFSAASVAAGVSPKRAASLRESANACGVELRRIKHEAHCLAVEMGIADMREGQSYGETSAPLGFGRDVLIDRRVPEVA